MKKSLIISVSLILIGCASLDTYSEYKQSSVSKIDYKGVTYKVRKHPSEDSLLVEGSVGQAVQIGLSFGSKVVPNSHIKQAAVRYLQNTKSECSVDDVDEIMDNAFVATLSC